MLSLWSKCLDILRAEYTDQQFNTWIMPLQADNQGDNILILFAPNQFVLEWIKDNFFLRISEIMQQLSGIDKEEAPQIILKIGEKIKLSTKPLMASTKVLATLPNSPVAASSIPMNSAVINIGDIKHDSNINPEFTFTTFVEGKSNQLARAAALQVAENPGKAYNPMFIYGGVGLGKTHLCHAIGNLIKKNNSQFKVLYLHSERFVADMVKALQTNRINDFKSF